MPVDHYENFPVASLLLPKALRYPITVIYRFARSADDLADEGQASATERLVALDSYRAQLAAIAAGHTPQDPLFVELAKVIRTHGLPVSLFADLLSAFAQDVAIDWQKGRVYLPLNELALFDLSPQDIARFAAGAPCSARWQDLMAFQTKRTRKLMLSGLPLVKTLPGRLRWEIALTVEGGLRILDKIDQCQGDIFRHRPVLTTGDWGRLLLRALRR